MFSTMASNLADLPAAKFPLCLQWVRDLEEKVRSGSWSAQVQQVQSSEAEENISHR